MTEANYAVSGGSISAWQPINGDWDCKYQAEKIRLLNYNIKEYTFSVPQLSFFSSPSLE